MTFYGITDVGKVRNNNQDNFRTTKLECGIVLAVVCDGMGGAAGGSQASLIATETFCEYIRSNENLFFDSGKKIKEKVIKSVMIAAVNNANTAVFKKSLVNPSLSGMGTTLVACMVYEDKIMAVNVGDSRIYAVYHNKAVRISKDHSYVQALVDDGVITEQQAQNHPNKNIILRAVGIDDSVEVDYFEQNTDMEYLLLCSDGLSNYITDDQIPKLLSGGKISDKAQKILEYANESGGNDNITAVLISLNDKEDNA